MKMHLLFGFTNFKNRKVLKIYLVKNVVQILAKENVFIFLERTKYYGK